MLPARSRRVRKERRNVSRHAHLTTSPPRPGSGSGSASCTRELSGTTRTRVGRRDADVDVHGPVDAVTEDTTVPEVFAPATRPSSYVHGVLGNPESACASASADHVYRREYRIDFLTCLGAEFLNSLRFLARTVPNTNFTSFFSISSVDHR